MPENTRYFLDRDNDGHWYLVPADKRDEWDAWTDLDPDDEASWDVPEWAMSLGYAPSLVTFENVRL
jgi:hypothetical protein